MREKCKAPSNLRVGVNICSLYDYEEIIFHLIEPVKSGGVDRNLIATEKTCHLMKPARTDWRASVFPACSAVMLLFTGFAELVAVPHIRQHALSVPSEGILATRNHCILTSRSENRRLQHCFELTRLSGASNRNNACSENGIFFREILHFQNYINGSFSQSLGVFTVSCKPL